jgi:hypothetical protein
MIVIRNKKKKLVWILVWAVLFIAVLYSPIGSPDLYTSKYYYTEYQSVTLNEGTIPNASKIKSSQEYNDDAPELPDISESLHANYAAGNYSSTPVSTSQGSYYGGGQTLSYQNNNSSGSGSGGGSFVVSGRSGSSAASSGFSMTSGITTLSLTSNLNATTPKQMTTASTEDDGGGTDPGGDPTGNPIPVGDGWGLFVVFGACYAVFKKGLRHNEVHDS